MRVTGPRLVLAGLAVCYLAGQFERAANSHHAAIASVRHDLAVALDVLAVLVIASLVMLVSYCRTGHPLPGHARPAPPPPPGRPPPGPLEHSAETVKLGDGVVAGPSVIPVEAPEGAEVPSLPGAGGSYAAHLDLAGKGSDE